MTRKYKNLAQSINFFLPPPEYKGHVELHCSDNCFIGYHTSCWRKFKGDRIVGADKELLSTLCPTPDCSGFVRIISVYDTNNKVKIKVSFGSEAIIYKF